MKRNDVPKRPIDQVAYPDALEAAEAHLVGIRRTSADCPPSTGAPNRLPGDAVGVGLSGGGVRSATFSLGVFQALARGNCLDRIDYLSTVSGGGYFGSFLGRLFTRDWIKNLSDVRQVLLAEEPPPTKDPRAAGWAAKVFRWLRENGRYLAPRGSADVLLLGAILLRNWVAVQLVLIVSALAAFAVLQIVRVMLERMLISFASTFNATAWLVCTMPLGNWLLWWSPLVVTPVVPLLMVAAPAGWAYWLVSRDADGVRGIPASVGAILALVLSGTGIYKYWATPIVHPQRLAACLVVAGVATLALVFYVVGEAVVRRIFPQLDASITESGNRLRGGLTKRMKNGLLACGVLLGAALIDTMGGTLYSVAGSGDLARWGAGVAGAFAVVGAFARPLFVLLAPTHGSARPRISMSLVSWIAAIAVMAVWLTSISVVSHALRWQFHEAANAPAGLSQTPVTPILGADALVIAGSGDERTVTARIDYERPACQEPPLAWPELPPFLVGSAVMLLLFAWLFGQTRRFANLSSVHGFYSDQLTRTFLGASNQGRLDRSNSKSRASSASVTWKGDDCSGARYWDWPRPPGFTPSREGAAAFRKPRTWNKGGPLHIVNTTVNETVDQRSGVQNRDRKGICLAIGPSALSLGIRHHLVTGDDGWSVFPVEEDSHRVFKADSPTPPEPLSLGKWMSISGAAFSAAAGANTTIPLAILCGMFNVRLGYWWNSGTGYGVRWMERVFPVQSAFFAEMFARTHGTSGQLWNLSDGGHFENMGGYELIRRRLPIIVIVDAEADPDYAFQGLSDLVRKARLDFRSEIVFLNAFELDGRGPDRPEASPLPASVRPYFGDLDALRRGKWTSEELTNNYGAPDRRFTLEVERTRPSKAHAALARVIHGDADDVDAPRSWLVYVKATLMGDEPEDVCHYHRGHPDFPQETTLDQFFDEAQWESYRRLGQHVGHRVLTTELFDHLRSHPA